MLEVAQVAYESGDRVIGIHDVKFGGRILCERLAEKSADVKIG